MHLPCLFININAKRRGMSCFHYNALILINLQKTGRGVPTFFRLFFPL